MQVSCNLNLAAVYLKLGAFAEAARCASAVLSAEGEADNVKARYRRGCARRKAGQLQEAKADLLRAAKLDPKNKVTDLRLAPLPTGATAQRGPRPFQPSVCRPAGRAQRVRSGEERPRQRQDTGEARLWRCLRQADNVQRSARCERCH